MRVSPHMQFLYQACDREENISVNTMGYHSASCAESMNQAMEPVRRCKFFEGLLALIHGESKRFAGRQRSVSRAVSGEKVLTPAGEEILEALELVRRRYSSTTQIWRPRSNTPSVQLHSGKRCRDVDLTTFQCSCGTPKVKTQPCPHVYIAGRAAGLPPHSIFPNNYYHVSTWRLQFSLNQRFRAVSKEDVLEFAQLSNTHLQVPSLAPSGPGRPGNHERFRGIDEQTMRRATKCSKCKQFGHNKRNKSCPLHPRRATSNISASAAGRLTTMSSA
eukprot:gb/GECG01001493.1/.p1 GENE.gb/GECG01001493.1/~~gb/GECG01001493.1/.p1  ORF type:complete len:275 (+),score=21.53 gb/GECG01001493.1/:1-825(+)